MNVSLEKLNQIAKIRSKMMELRSVLLEKIYIPGRELSWNGTKNIGRVLNGILSLENEIFLAGASKSLKILKFLKKWQIVEKSQIHLFKTNVAEKTSRTLGTAHFIQIDIEYDWIYRHF